MSIELLNMINVSPGQADTGITLCHTDWLLAPNIINVLPGQAAHAESNRVGARGSESEQHKGI